MLQSAVGKRLEAEDRLDWTAFYMDEFQRHERVQERGDGMTKREFLDTVFALAPNEANAIMDAFDEYNGRSVEAIRKLPPAQPEPKMGKWERHYCEDGNPDGWQCDKCKEWYYFGQTLPNFCPNCGADMREVTE